MYIDQPVGRLRVERVWLARASTTLGARDRSRDFGEAMADAVCKRPTTTANPNMLAIFPMLIFSPPLQYPYRLFIPPGFVKECGSKRASYLPVVRLSETYLLPTTWKCKSSVILHSDLHRNSVSMVADARTGIVTRLLQFLLVLHPEPPRASMLVVDRLGRHSIRYAGICV